MRGLSCFGILLRFEGIFPLIFLLPFFFFCFFFCFFCFFLFFNFYSFLCYFFFYFFYFFFFLLLLLLLLFLLLCCCFFPLCFPFFSYCVLVFVKQRFVMCFFYSTYHTDISANCNNTRQN